MRVFLYNLPVLSEIDIEDIDRLLFRARGLDGWRDGYGTSTVGSTGLGSSRWDTIGGQKARNQRHKTAVERLAAFSGGVS